MYGYQSLEAWSRADAAVILILRALESNNNARTFAIFDQIRRATVSVAANIVEGYALGTVGLYRKHLRIAFGSAAEAEYLLKACGRLEYIPSDVVDQGEKLLGGAMKAIYGLMRKPPRRFQPSHIPPPTSHAV
jgi:four helix bundle protein